jgi:translation initiation factor 1 (eIF-1/SUI1)
MSKRSKPIDTSGGAKLTHSPFAALAGTPAAAAPVAFDERPPAVRGARSEVPVVFAPKVVVRREKKGRGGKTATRITGIGAEHREELAGRMKSALGCGAVVEGEDVVLLGSLVERAADWLEGQGAKRVVRS